MSRNQINEEPELRSHSVANRQSFRLIWYGLLFVSTALLSSLAHSTDGPSTNADGATVDSEIRSFDYDDLRRLLGRRQPQRVEELLAELPERFKSKAVFVKDSGSLQESSPVAPRVLLYGTGDLVITFNSTPNQSGFEALEITHYDLRKHEFFFEEYVFPSDLEKRREAIRQNGRANGDTKASIEQAIGELTNRSNRQGLNPNLCSQCHESPSHPLLPGDPSGSSFIGGYAGEKDLTTDFIRTLQNLYSTNSRLISVSQGKRFGEKLASGEANREFNRLMNERNWDRIAARLLRNERFKKEGRALLGALADCDGSSATRITRVRNVIEQRLGISMAEGFATDGTYGSYKFDGADGGIEGLLKPLVEQITKERPDLARDLPPLEPRDSLCKRLAPAIDRAE